MLSTKWKHIICGFPKYEVTNQITCINYIIRTVVYMQSLRRTQHVNLTKGIIDKIDKIKILILSNYTTIEIGEYIHLVPENNKTA